MSKGRRLRLSKRNRTRRVPAAPPADDRPFLVDPATADKLGLAGLAAVARNVWPLDCQSCGWALGSDKPALVVTDFIVFATADLHHARCHRPEWITQPTLHKDAVLSWRSQSVVISIGTPLRQEYIPGFVLNPSVESVYLRPDGQGWHIATVQHYAQVGLAADPSTLLARKALRDTSAHLDGDTLTVRLDDTGQEWTALALPVVKDLVNEQGGVLLAITTALGPDDLGDIHKFFSAVDAGEVALGWLPLAGREPELTDIAAPDSLTTFVLHWSDQHTNLGRLIAETGRSLTPAQAQTWALEFLPEPQQLLRGWQEIGHDPNAWYALDIVSMDRHLLRRHTDAWRLVQSISETAGAPAGDQNLRQWATRAARVKGGARIVDWVDAPTTSPGFRTMHGSGIPR